MYKYLSILLLFFLPACESFDAAKFDQALMANAVTIQEYESVSEALSAFIDIAIEQNGDNPIVLQGLLEWKKELEKCNMKIAVVAEKLAHLVRGSRWPKQIKETMIDLFLQISQKWLNK